jgi:hypothetical protein
MGLITGFFPPKNGAVMHDCREAHYRWRTEHVRSPACLVSVQKKKVICTRKLWQNR